MDMQGTLSTVNCGVDCTGLEVELDQAACCFFLAAHLFLAASPIFFRASGLRTRFALRFFGADFFAAVASAARFAAHLFFIAAMMFARPSALKCLFRRPFLMGELFAATRFGPEPSISRNAEIARSIASRCCSSCATTLVISLT